MNSEDKIALLDLYEEIDSLTDEQFCMIKTLSFDPDFEVRCRIAALLVNYVNEYSKEILLRMARDEDSLVRTEAYDSLSVYPYNDVEELLQNALQTEDDELARSYAILSWADVIVQLNCVCKSKINFLLVQKAGEKIEACLLCFCYAQYVFGDKDILSNILLYLRSENYQIRCTTLSLLSDIVDDKNISAIHEAIVVLLIGEKNVAVRNRAQRLLEEA